ncbi:MAG: TonB-dependent receptor family protein [Prevotella sp.]|nr:TonB-dependent receptor family protein [Prevotella sp.]MCM1475227.1 TonB-dependent receptor family protein [Muribaculaceae bacterium]
MKIRTVIATILYISAITAMSQTKISGRIIEKRTSEPLEFVTVALIEEESGKNLPIGTMSDIDGKFLLEIENPGSYIIKFTNLGMVPQERNLNIGKTPIDLGTIEMAEDSKMLQEIVVTGQKSQMTVDSEHRVFNVSSNISSGGATAEELLGSVPSVNVNHDGEISLRGNSDVLVWINGKQMGMNADNRSQMLRQIPAESIASIEVMTNPSSRHSADGTAGIINIILKEKHQEGYYGSADASVDTRGTSSLNFNFNYNRGKFETFAGLGLRSRHQPGGVESERIYTDGTTLISQGKIRKNENSGFLRLGANYFPNDNNMIYINAIGTLGHKWGRTETLHNSTIPGLWESNHNLMREKGDTKGANIMVGYKHTFSSNHYLDMNVSYNIWQGPNDNNSTETEYWGDKETPTTTVYRGQHQDVKINNWEAAVDYSIQALPWLRLDAGYHGNYNHENSPASYSSGTSPDNMIPLNNLYNRFKYSTDINSLFIDLKGGHDNFSFAAGLRAESWQIRTRSLSYGQSDIDVDQFKKSQLALFPSASISWDFYPDNELKLTYSRRIRRPYGPQLNTFENIADPSEVHLGNPLIQPEFSNTLELTYIKTWHKHLLTATAYLRAHKDMISHVSFLAPMASNPDINTMYYGHANVGNMTDAGIEIISRNTLTDFLTLTTTVNLYNSHMKAWKTEYPLHDDYYPVSGRMQNRFVYDIRMMASLKLPWGLNFQATGRYNSQKITAQGRVESDWDLEAGIKRNFRAWGISLVCKDIFGTKKSHDILYGQGYTQSISKWLGGRTLRLSVSYNFGKSNSEVHERHIHIDTGGYGEGHNH